MKIPPRLQPLVDEGLIDEVISRLMSGKEADVFVVRCNGVERCAKVYKDSNKRSFKKATLYQEGRKSRNTRRSRAMEKASSYGRRQREETWHNAEVDALYKLAGADVRVPTPYGCVDGVLLMELITDEDGEVAPRLGEVSMSTEQAEQDHSTVIQYIVRMLCIGLIHGDLSEFNILVDPYGPVIIDLPQVVDAAANNNAKALLFRDVNRITQFYAQFAPQLRNTRYDQEMWALFCEGELYPDIQLTGEYHEEDSDPDVDGELQEIKAILEEEEQRQASRSLQDDRE